MSTPKPREWWIAETLGSWKVFADKAHAEFCMRGCGYTDAELAAELIHVIEYAQLAGLAKDHADDWKRIQDAERARVYLTAQLAEVTRERDANARWFRDCNADLNKERAKAERFRGALEYIKTASKAQGFMFAHDEASKALTEAEGE